MRIPFCLATVAALAALAFPVAAQCPLDTQSSDPNDRTCYVSTTGNDLNAGTRAAPLRNVQSAIEIAFASTAFQTIRVLPGTYTECIRAYFEDTNFNPIPTNLDIVADDFLANAVRTTTILDGTTVCGALTASPGAVVEIGDQSLLRGFTIRGGGDSGVLANGHVQITNNIITGNSTPREGGGIALYTGLAIADADFDAVIALNRVEDNEAANSGGGIYVAAVSGLTLPTDVTISSNEILSNRAEGGILFGAVFGGGLAVATETFGADEIAKVVITANTIDGNVAAPGAGGLATYGGGVSLITNGFGNETIEVKPGVGNVPNAIRNNSVEGGYGAGIAARAQANFDGNHVVKIESNAITANTSDLGGGGMYLLALALDVDATANAQIVARSNNVSGNAATAPLGTFAAAGGGGIYGEYYSERSVSPGITLDIEGNTFRQNLTDSLGGGAALYARAYTELQGGSTPGAAVANLRFSNNLVIRNDALGAAPGGTRDGGGAYAIGVASGSVATADLELEFNTFADNDVDAGGGGGVALDAVTLPDSVGQGSVSLDVSDSIFLRNDGYGVGGPAIPGFSNVTASITYNDFFENIQGTVAANLEDSASNNVTFDPELDVNFNAPFCSPTIDAADPLQGTFVGARLQEETQPNGGRANLGHTGLTSSATVTLPDVNGSGRVDGADVLDLAFAFASNSSQQRYNANADRDRDGDVDGDDLSYVAAYFGRSCP